jgi:hypothetical protein
MKILRKLAQTAKGAVKTLGRAAKTLAPAVGLALGGAIAYSDHKTKEFQKEIEASKPPPAPSSTVKPSKVDRDYTDTLAFKKRLDYNRSLPQPAWMSPHAQKAQAEKDKAERAQMNRDVDASIAKTKKEFQAKIKKSEADHAQRQLHEDILHKKQVAEQKMRQAKRQTKRRRKGKG